MIYVKIHKPGNPLEYMNSKGFIREDMLEKVEIEVDEFQTRILYYLTTENQDTIMVDGETFRQL